MKEMLSIVSKYVFLQKLKNTNVSPKKRIVNEKSENFTKLSFKSYC